MKTEHPTPKKHDLLLIVILLLISAAVGIGYHLKHRAPALPGAAASDTEAVPALPGETASDAEALPALRAEVTIDGETKAVLDLSKEQEITIESVNEGTNHLVIQGGEIWCDDASCPDKVCVYQGHQSRDGDIIVCLPNRMIVQIIDSRPAPSAEAP